MRRGLLFLAACLAIGWSIYSQRETIATGFANWLGTSQEKPVPIRTLEPVDYQIEVETRGRLTGLRTTALRTPRVRGSLKVGWMVEEGTLVREGATLIRFDNTDALLTLQENQNTVRTYDSRLDQNELEREAELFALQKDRQAAELEVDFAQNQVRKDEQIFTQWEIQESLMSAALAEYKMLSVDEKAEVRGQLSDADRRILAIEQDKAEQEVAEAQQKLSSLELKAPSSGVVIYTRRGFRNVELGADVWPGQTIMEVADLDSFRGELWIVEADIAGIEPGKNVRVTLDAYPEKTFSGRVESISRVAEQRSRQDPRRYFACQVALETTPEIMAQFKPGMRLTGTIAVARKEGAFVLPKSAVLKKENQFFVFLKEGEEFSQHPVEVVDSDHGFYVIQGVESAQQVALRNPFEAESLQLPDFSGPSTTNRRRRFVIVD